MLTVALGIFTVWTYVYFPSIKKRVFIGLLCKIIIRSLQYYTYHYWKNTDGTKESVTGGPITSPFSVPLKPLYLGRITHCGRPH